MIKEERNRKQSLALVLLVIATLCTVFLMTRDVQAAKAGFKTINGKTYYITASGAKQKGWLTLKGKKYYFNKKTGVQLKGWQKDSKGRNIRYFTKGKGVMATGFLKSGTVTRYFRPSNGKLVRGWLTLKGKKYYFTSGTGAMVKGWQTTAKKEKRYFKSNGQMLTGWFTDSKGYTRYFNTSTGIMYTGLKTVDGDIYYFPRPAESVIRKALARLEASGIISVPQTAKRRPAG